MRTPWQAALLEYIRAGTRAYQSYYKWIVGDPKMRGFYMHIHRRDWECAAALYKADRRKAWSLHD